ncbi:hypothetical protein CEXT_377971 [Caerostris extrusa]|uniref:Uncharacterized protein n=1 Tax=Caerostris extrusa TaxID=172846 RepID=A0AAV4WU64_CAEEX|nr:hypothetical protein CEXT_377971 [Caerostris extrusa]
MPPSSNKGVNGAYLKRVRTQPPNEDRSFVWGPAHLAPPQGADCGGVEDLSSDAPHRQPSAHSVDLTNLSHSEIRINCENTNIYITDLVDDKIK